MIRKTNNPDVLQQILDKLTIIDTRLTKIDTRLTKVESLQAKDHKLLLNVIRLNNLKTK